MDRLLYRDERSKGESVVFIWLIAVRFTDRLLTILVDSSAILYIQKDVERQIWPCTYITYEWIIAHLSWFFYDFIYSEEFIKINSNFYLSRLL